MTGRKRPSGNGAHSTRFAEVKRDGDILKIPVVKDAWAFLFLADEGGDWPKKPSTVLLVAADFREGDVFELEEGRPGSGMGTIMSVKVLEVVRRVVIHPGKFGPVKYMILVVPVVSNKDFGDLTSDEYRALNSTEVPR